MDLFEDIEGLGLVDPASLVEYERAMKDDVIPEIMETMKRRAEYAREFRGFLW